MAIDNQHGVTDINVQLFFQLGASIVKKFKLKIPGVLKLSILFTLISCATTVFFFFSCPQNSVAGISVPYPGMYIDKRVLEMSLMIKYGDSIKDALLRFHNARS